MLGDELIPMGVIDDDIMSWGLASTRRLVLAFCFASDAHSQWEGQRRRLRRCGGRCGRTRVVSVKRLMMLRGLSR